MTINSHAVRFANLPVKQYDSEEGLSAADSTAYCIACEYDDELGMEERLRSLLADPDAERLRALIIGSWEAPAEDTMSGAATYLAEHSSKLPNLRALFIGDIVMEECEISWIMSMDYSQLVHSFPKLEVLKIRGGNDLRLRKLASENLRELTIEAGGLSSDLIEDVLSAALPNLEELQLWLGTEDYGFDGTLEQLNPLFHSNPFPKLKRLRLRNSDIADQIAAALADAPILDQIEFLDLSMGTLRDTGGEVLLLSNKVKQLKKLDLHHHFLSNEMMARLSELPLEVNVAEQQQVEDDFYFVAVSE